MIICFWWVNNLKKWFCNALHLTVRGMLFVVNIFSLCSYGANSCFRSFQLDLLLLMYNGCMFLLVYTVLCKHTVWALRISCQNGLIVITIFEVRLKKDITVYFVWLCYYDREICNYSCENNPKYVLKAFINYAVFLGHYLKTYVWNTLEASDGVFSPLMSMLSVYFFLAGVLKACQGRERSVTVGQRSPLYSLSQTICMKDKSLAEWKGSCNTIQHRHLSLLWWFTVRFKTWWILKINWIFLEDIGETVNRASKRFENMNHSSTEKCQW